VSSLALKPATYALSKLRHVERASRLDSNREEVNGPYEQHLVLLRISKTVFREQVFPFRQTGDSP
jgi:hypothetical protein